MRTVYSEEEKIEAAEYAGDNGYAKTLRDLKYPKSWSTLRNWCEELGIDVELDELKAKAASFNSFYNESDLIIVQQEVIARCRELLQENTLTPVEVDKLAAAIKRATEVIQLLNGKATSRHSASESKTDEDIKALLDTYNKNRSVDV